MAIRLVAIAAVFGVSAGQSLVPPFAVVDMSLRPTDHFKEAVRVSLRRWSFEEGFHKLFAQWNTTTFDQLTTDDYTVLTTSLEKYFPQQALELRGISDEFAAHGHQVSYEYLAAWAYSHEIGHFAPKKAPHQDCSALLVSDTHGHLMHGRNMDQGAPDFARKVTLKLKYINLGEGREDVSALDFYWFAGGMVTAVVKNGVSMQENWRSINAEKGDIVDRISKGAVPHKYMFREMMFKNGITSFKPAVEFLQTLPFAAPVYIALGGAGDYEAAILTRNATTIVVPVQHLAEKWFAVETNHDNWLPDPPTDPRRTAAEKCIEGSGHADNDLANGVNIFKCISTKPVLNKGTIYTAVMNPRTGDMSAWVRFDAASTSPEEFSITDVLVV